MRTAHIISLLLVVAILAFPAFAFAGGPGFSGGVNDGGNSCAVPLDGGLSLLIASGIGYAAKKFAKKKKYIASHRLKEQRLPPL